MKSNIIKFSLCSIVLLFISQSNVLTAQEYDLSGFELSIDQDYFADFLRDSTEVSDNHTISLRLGFYGALANHPYLGVTFVRQLADGFLLDKILYNSGFRETRRSHSFHFTINGFSPAHISNQIPEFQEAVDNGYAHIDDRPFSSFTGFRATRRLEGNKLFVHSAHQVDMAINSSFTFGFASFGFAKGIENLFGANRPDGNLWSEDETLDYPSGQVNFAPMPLFMYSLSAEAVMWRPLKKVIVQLRPELNLGYYTNIGLGLDLGKVMNVESTVDNLGYTDLHNPGVLVVNNEHLSIALSAGVTARAVLYNAHLTGWFGWRDDHYIPVSDVRKFVLESYAGIKLQLFKKIEFNFSINNRSSEFIGAQSRSNMWGTFGMKYLLAEEGEGCYD